MKSIFTESFKNHLVSNYLSKNPKKIMFSHYFKLIDFLTEDQIIPKKQVRIYTVINEYKYLLEEKKHKNKTQLIKAISEKFDLHENTIWNIVRDHLNSFEAAEEIEQD